MAFENLTLFELNFEGAQFGPRNVGEGEASEEGHEEHSGARGRRALWFVGGLAMIAVAVAMRRRFDGREAGIEIEETDVETAVQ